jgi:hypothetical protein
LRKTVKATFKNALKYGKFLFAEFQRNQWKILCLLCIMRQWDKAV